MNNGITNIITLNRQLTLDSMSLVQAIISHFIFNPDKLNDKFCANIFDLAKKWDAKLADGVNPKTELHGQGENHE